MKQNGLFLVMFLAGVLVVAGAGCSGCGSKQTPAERAVAKFEELRAKGDADGAVRSIVKAMKKKSCFAARETLVRESARAFLDAGQFDKAEAILAGAAAVFKDDAAVKALVAVTRADSLVMQGRWKDAAGFITAEGASMQDGALAVVLSKIVLGAGDIEGGTLVERVCDHVIRNLRDRPAACAVAATGWVRAATARGETASAIERMGSLTTSGIGDSAVFSAYDSEFYRIMEPANIEQRKALLKIGHELYPRLKGDEQKGVLATFLADGAFMTEDYAAAVGLIEKGIPGRDKRWHALSITKLKAHLDLKEGRKLEAVAGFREFMKLMAADPIPYQIDPIASQRLPNEMVLGLNARRIGDILASTGDTNAAAAAYDEARGYYRVALQSLDKSSAEYRRVEDGLNSVPGGTGAGDK